MLRLAAALRDLQDAPGANAELLHCGMPQTPGVHAGARRGAHAAPDPRTPIITSFEGGYRRWKRTSSTRSRTPSRTWPRVRRSSGGIFDYDAKKSRLVEVGKALEDPKVWDDAKRAQDLGKERRALEETVSTMEKIDSGLKDSGELFALAKAEGDDATLVGVRERRRRPRASSWRTSSSAACSPTRWTRTTASSTSTPARAAPRRRTGRRCCCACTSSTATARASRPRSSRRARARSRA